MNNVCLNIATHRKRRASFRKMLETVAKQRYDFVLNIYLNDYPCPKWLDQWADNQKFEVNVVEGSKADGNLKAAAKFYFAKHHKGPYITADDDILLPGDYVGYMHHLIEKHKGAFVSFHAHKHRIKPITGIYSRNGKVWQYGEGCAMDREVDTVGTGVLGFDTRLIQVDHTDFQGYEIMTDPILVKIAAERGIRLMTATRVAGWLKTVPKSQKHAIWRNHVNDEQERVKILNEAFEIRKNRKP